MRWWCWCTDATAVLMLLMHCLCKYVDTAAVLTADAANNLKLLASYRFSPLLTASHRFSLFLTVSHRFSSSPSLPSPLSFSSPPSTFWMLGNSWVSLISWDSITGSDMPSALGLVSNCSFLWHKPLPAIVLRYGSVSSRLQEKVQQQN